MIVRVIFTTISVAFSELLYKVTGKLRTLIWYIHVMKGSPLDFKTAAIPRNSSYTLLGGPKVKINRPLKHNAVRSPELLSSRGCYSSMLLLVKCNHMKAVGQCKVMLLS